jgi:hypothetical protein
MPKEQSPGKPNTRQYSEEEKAAAVRMVRTLRAELGTEHSVKARNRLEPDCRARQPAMTTTDVLGAFEGYVAAEDGFRRLLEAGPEQGVGKIAGCGVSAG